MSRTTLLLAVIGAILLALTATALFLHLPTGYVDLDDDQKHVVVGILVFAGVLYLIASYVVCHHVSSRRAIQIVIGVAIALRVALVFGDPVLSSDIYRYVWDGQVQKAGINPYRYVPTDPALKSVRDTRVYPLINRADYAHTIYPPTAQIVFAVVGRISGSVAAMKLAMVGFELLACWCMLKVLAFAQLPAERILIYAWNPLVLSSFAYDGHVDAIGVGLLALALLLRARHRPGAAGATLAAASLVKFLPAIVAPAFVRGGKLWRPLLAGILTVVLLYALYASVGTKVMGFLSGYGDEEGLNDASGVWLMGGLSKLINLSSYLSDRIDLSDGWARTYFICFGLFMAALSAWIALRKLKPYEVDAVVLCRDTGVLAGCTMVLISPHYAWYFAWLALPSVVAPIPAVLWLSVAPVILYMNPWNEQFFWPGFIYIPAIVLAGFALWQNAYRPRAVLVPS